MLTSRQMKCANHQHVCSSCNKEILKETVQQRSQNQSWARKKSSNFSSGSHCQAASGASEWRWGPPAYSRYSKETFFTISCLPLSDLLASPRGVLHRGGVGAGAMPNWARGFPQQPSQHSPLPWVSTIYYSVLELAYILCGYMGLAYYCVDIAGSSCRGGVDTPLPLSDTFLQIFRRIFGEWAAGQAHLSWQHVRQRVQPAATWYSRKLHLETGKEYKHNYRCKQRDMRKSE